jgi:glycerol-3-phosphate acyltransferase PlsY
MRLALAITIGYLLGSILPAVLFARFRGVEIRDLGTRNPGATNALEELGLGPGVVTLVYDSSVGLVSMYIAYLLGLPIGQAYLAGLAAVVGHCFPVFFGFRGGQGMAATTGMLLFEIGVGMWRGWLTIPGMALLVVIAAVVFLLTRSATDVGVFVVPLLVAEVVLGRPEWQTISFISVLALWIWLVQLSTAWRGHLFRLAAPVKRRAARPRV